MGQNKHHSRRTNSNAGEDEDDEITESHSPSKRLAKRASSRARKNSHDDKQDDIEMAHSEDMNVELVSTPVVKDSKKSKKQVQYSKIADEVEAIDEDDATVLVTKRSSKGKNDDAMNPMITDQALDAHDTFLIEESLATDLPVTPPPTRVSMRSNAPTIPPEELSQRNALNLQSPLK